MAKSPSQAKNAVMRCLRGIVDPYPSDTEVARVWAFFVKTCVYCGLEMERADRKGHLDHLVAFKDGGANDLGNYVLACRDCNGNEKREENWETFLRRKNPDEEDFQRRKAKIEQWVALNAPSRRIVPADQRQAVLAAFEQIVAVLDPAVARLRGMRPPKPPKKTVSKPRCATGRKQPAAQPVAPPRETCPVMIGEGRLLGR
ncbi:MAG: HNH endonuclease [Planctomycetes bacterium]|nr:HNH endonuclease [Planctomycetota bacterium]